MITAPALEVHGSHALARLGSRVSIVYLVGTAFGAAAALGSDPAPPWAGLPPAAAMIVLAAVVALGLERSGRGSSPVPLRVLAARAAVLGAGCLVLALVVAAGPAIGWARVHLLAGWILPGVGLGLALAAGPWWGMAALVVLGACFALLLPPAAAGAVPATLAGASVSVVVAGVIHVSARRGFGRVERELRAAEAAGAARVRAEQRLLAGRRLDRLLHDTVLSTLTLLAHGGRGVDPEQVRAACRRDLAALRSDRWGGAATADPPPAAAAAAVTGAAVVAASAVGGAAAGAAADAVVSIPRQEAPLTERLDAMRELAARRGLDLRVHLQAAGEIDLRPVPAGPAVLDLAALEAWSSALTECVVNITRHAGVAAADLVLGRTDDTLVTLVVDEGAGFEVSAVRPERLGLSGSVRDRLEDVGGRARVWSRPGEGTVVELVLPLPRNTPRPAPDAGRESGEGR